MNRVYFDIKIILNNFIQNMATRAEDYTIEQLEQKSESPAFSRFLEMYGKQRTREQKEEGDVILNFGKHKGKTFDQIYTDDSGYIAWFCGRDTTPYNRRAKKYFLKRIEEDFQNDENDEQ